MKKMNDARKQREITRSTVDSINLSKCNGKLLHEIRKAIDRSSGEGKYGASLYVEDAAHFYTGFSNYEIEAVRKYLVDTLGYDVHIVSTGDRAPSNNWYIHVSW